MNQQPKPPADQGGRDKAAKPDSTESNLSAIGRIQVMIDAAERSATEIAESAALLTKRASEIRIESEELIASLEETKAELQQQIRGGSAALRGQDKSRPMASKPETEDTGDVEGNGLSAGARLLATQMSVAGSSRDEIESRLRNEFHIDEPESMLDGILGARESAGRSE